MSDNLTSKILKTSINYIAVFSIPLNIVVFFAIRNSERQIIRLMPIILGLLVIILAFFRKKIECKFSSLFFVIILFFSGLFNLLLGLIDLASL